MRVNERTCLAWLMLVVAAGIGPAALGGCCQGLPDWFPGGRTSDRAAAAPRLPREFPAAGPSCPGGTLTWTWNTGAGHVAVLETREPRGALLDYYTRDLPGRGWQVARRVESGDGFLVVLRQPPRRSVMVTVGESPGRRTCMLQTPAPGMAP